MNYFAWYWFERRRLFSIRIRKLKNDKTVIFHRSSAIDMCRFKYDLNAPEMKQILSHHRFKKKNKFRKSSLHFDAHANISTIAHWRRTFFQCHFFLSSSSLVRTSMYLCVCVCMCVHIQRGSEYNLKPLWLELFELLTALITWIKIFYTKNVLRPLDDDWTQKIQMLMQLVAILSSVRQYI